MTEYAKSLQALAGALGAGATGNELEFRRTTSQAGNWLNDTAVATNTAISERLVVRARQKCRLVAVGFCPSAAITGTATDFMTLLIAKRLASNPATKTNLLTVAFDTATTDDAAAFGTKDLLAAATIATYQPTAVSADFELLEGDVLTCEVTKSSATGMTYPVANVYLLLEPRT